MACPVTRPVCVAELRVGSGGVLRGTALVRLGAGAVVAGRGVVGAVVEGVAAGGDAGTRVADGALVLLGRDGPLVGDAEGAVAADEAEGDVPVDDAEAAGADEARDEDSRGELLPPLQPVSRTKLATQPVANFRRIS